MLDDYNNKLLGIILDVDTDLLDEYKPAAVEAIHALESDDLSYTYHPTAPEVTRKRSKTIARINDYWPPRHFELEAAIKQAVDLFLLEDNTYQHMLVVLTNRYQHVADGRKLRHALMQDHKKLGVCSFLLCGLGEKYNPAIKEAETYHPRCQFCHVESPEDFSAAIKRMVYGQANGSLDYVQLRKDYEALDDREEDIPTEDD